MARGGSSRRPVQAARPVARRPYRDATIFHGALALLIVLVAWLAGSDLQRAAIVAVLYFVAATGWSWWRFRQRGRRAASEEAKP